MPPLPRIHTRVLADLATQLRFAPAEALRRQMSRAEDLAGEVLAEGVYPEDWVAFRVTGYRPDGGATAVIAGEALLSDLSAFVERLSAAAPGERDSASFLSAEALEARWNVSRKTIDRWRRRGLMAHRARGDDGRSRLIFPLSSVERFEVRHAEALAEASKFSRIPDDVARRMVRRARAYQRRLGCSLNQAAARLASRYGRSLEAVRQLLRRAEDAAPVFEEPGPPSARERRLIDRAARRAIEPADIARHLGRRVPGVRRVIIDQRAARLRALALPAPPDDSPTEAAPDDACRDGLGMPGVTDVLAFVDAGRAQSAPGAELERSRARGYHALLRHAARLIRELPAHGAPAARVDEAETSLRWAARLKAELIRSQFPVMIRALETTLGRRLEEVRAASLVTIVEEALRALGDAVDAFHASSRGGRLAAPAGLHVTRAAARLLREGARDLGNAGAGRAVPRLRPGVPLADWTRRVAPWQAFLEPPERVRAALGRLDEGSQRVLALRHGWGGPPHTLADLAKALGTTTMRAGVLERRSLRAALRA